jgi:dipeptidyl aminopeptidase/acylaminoacyl peptidase
MQPPRRKAAIEDLLRFRQVSEPQLSPDGKQVLFVVTQYGPRNETQSDLWLVQTDGRAAALPLTTNGRERSPRWSPDGTRIASVRGDPSQGSQVWMLDASGGEARQLTRLPPGEVRAIQWSPDGGSLAVVFFEPPADRPSGVAAPARIVDHLPYRLEGIGFLEGAAAKLHLIDAASGAHRLLYTSTPLDDLAFDFAPDSMELVVSTCDDKAWARYWHSNLVRIRVTDGEVTPIPDLPEGPKLCVRWSPDGALVGYVGCVARDGSFIAENHELLVCDPKRGGARSLTAHADLCLRTSPVGGVNPLPPRGICFAEDSARLYFQVSVRGRSRLGSVPSSGGAVTLHDCGEMDIGLWQLEAGMLALTVTGATQGGEVAVARLAGVEILVQPLTQLNSALCDELELVAPRLQHVAVEPDHEVPVWVMLPPSLSEGQTVPAVLAIHGGPHVQYGTSLNYELALLVAQGFAVFFSNPRGSKGYGRAYSAAIRGGWAKAAWRDIEAVLGFMAAQPFVDSRRLAVMGHSYGGYLALWAIGHDQRLAAAVADSCISNLVSWVGTTDLTPRHLFADEFGDAVERLWYESPIRYFGAVKTPTLFLHAEGDERCRIEQSEQAFALLKSLGVPTRFVRYPASVNHNLSVSGPGELRMHRLEHVVGWLNLHLKD